MFRSLFCEGFSRPAEGVRPLMKLLTRRYKELGGELRLRAGVRRIVHDGNNAFGVELDDGTQLQTQHLLSSAGYVETMRLCDRADATTENEAGRLGFVEACSVLNRRPADLGIDRAIVFFSTDDQFHWQRPKELVDLRSGVLCMPQNFDFECPADDGMVRTTALADFEAWSKLPEPEYRAAKEHWYPRLAETSAKILGDFRPHVVDVDMFTPTTIVRYTGHAAGAIYGAPKKRYDGATFLHNLYLCGTDQGYVGIIGALVSGIAAANHRVLTNA